MPRRIEILAPAKINLRLLVLAREASGYHSLETLFCGISLADSVRVESSPEPGVRLVMEGDAEIDTGPADDNLVVRAAAAYLEAANIVDEGATVRLEKRIPAAAGLGGGSSDAAATLRGMDALYDGLLGQRRLLDLGAALGSDVPFFLTATPYALAWGRGERLLSLPPLPQRPVLVAHPGVSMPTAKAFARLAQLREGQHSAGPDSFPLEAVTSWDAVRDLARNDFDIPAFELIPHLPQAARLMTDAGATIAMLAGSGASIFGIFESPDRRDEAARNLTRMGLANWPAVTLSEWPRPLYPD